MKKLIVSISVLSVMQLMGCVHGDGSTPDGCSAKECMTTVCPVPATPPCQAARGLLGSVISAGPLDMAGPIPTCIDFDNPAIKDTNVLTGLGWKFGGPAGCWTISDGKLLINNMSSGVCTVDVPAVDLKNFNMQRKTNYTGVMLSLDQAVSLPNPNYSGTIRIAGQSEPILTMITMAVKDPAPFRRTLVGVDDKLIGTGNTYQFQLEANLTVAIGKYTGWQISSLAVVAVP